MFKRQGFSMLELMVVLAITAILAMVAVPNYKLYVNKAKFSEVTQAVSSYRAAVDICSHMLGGLGDAGRNCGTPGQNGIPRNYQGDPSHGFVASIKTVYKAPDVEIVADSQRLTENASFILSGHMDTQGELIWQVDPTSSCLAIGICHAG